MMKHLGAVAAIALAWVAGSPQTANACDQKSPRCQSLNELVVSMGYAAGIGQARAACEVAAGAWEPDRMPMGSRHILKGLNKSSEDWPKVEDAFQTYVSEACGGAEIEYLILEGYRIAWDARAPGAALEAAVKAVRSGTQSEQLAGTAKQVSLDVNRAIGPLLEGMTTAAMRNYQNRLTAIATGEFMAMVGNSCAPKTPGTVKDGREKLVWPPKRGG